MYELINDFSIDALILTGGKAPKLDLWRPLLQNNPIIIAADSGLAQVLDEKISVDHIIGDFDSLPDATNVIKHYPQATIHSYPSDKDETDTELALLLSQQMQHHTTALVGGGEGRLDHLLAITQLFKASFSPSLWLTAEEIIIPISPDKPFQHSLAINTTLSFFPLETETKTTQCKGLRWPLTHLNQLYSQMSLSNRTTESHVSITLSQGLLLAIIPHRLG